MRAAAVILLLGLAACGADADEATTAPAPTTSATPATTASTQDAVEPATVAPKGTPAPEALQRFRCEKNAKGVWKASGYLVNGGKAPATFQVTVLVGEASGTPLSGKTKQVPSIAPDGSVKFVIEKVPAPDSGGTCHVQVLATK